MKHEKSISQLFDILIWDTILSVVRIIYYFVKINLRNRLFARITHFKYIKLECYKNNIKIGLNSLTIVYIINAAG